VLERNALTFPTIDPVAFHLGPLEVRWYGLAYLAGIVGGLWLARRYVHRYREFGLAPDDVEDFSFWSTLGILVGGRIGYILLYHPAQYWSEPLAMLRLYEGGMAFHGGLLGVALTAVLFCRARRIPLLHLTDVVACVVPIGLGLGRVANFVNGELWGRATTLPWGMVFPSGGPLPRHPSQLYEAALEGLLLFALLSVLIRRSDVRAAHGLLTGLFLATYGLIRFAIEVVREPDASLIWDLTRGQAFSVPMILSGTILCALAWHGRLTSQRGVSGGV
jgi:phosphatidylglycerol:prolipoprotein diacylglycerol transferase